MTEENDDGSNLVRVRAQVMMRDDSTGGWVPMGGGGLSNVSVRKRIIQADNLKPEYFIYGKRLSDQTVVLSCTIKKDFQYNKVMPTFHHWVTGDHKFGLTFQTAADARAFDKGVRLAVNDIIEGLREIPSHLYGYCQHSDLGDDEVFMAVILPVERDGSRSSSGSVTTCSSGSRHTPTTTPLPTPDHPPHSLHTTTSANTTPDLPLHFHHHHYHHHHHHHHHHLPPTGGSTPPVGTSTTNISPASTLSTPAAITSDPLGQQHLSNHHHHRMMYLPCQKPPAPPPPGPATGTPEKGDKIQMPSDAYVDFARGPAPLNHEYSYPVLEGSFKGAGERRDSIASLKKKQQLWGGGQGAAASLPLSLGKQSRKRTHARRGPLKARCRFCHDPFSEERNPRGGCEFAPDLARAAIDRLTCIACARCMLYHCLSDAEGDFSDHPCECGGRGPPLDEACGRRWLGLTILSLLVPCLWCYLPLRGCHRCAVACGLCGGRHES